MTETLPSRGLRGYAGGALAGVISAGLFGFAFANAGSLFIMLAYLAAIPLFIVGLGAGVTSGAVASIVGVAGLFLARQFNFAMFFAVTYALPAAVLAALAMRRNDVNGKKEWYSEGNLLTAITLYPCLAFMAAFAAAVGHDGGLLAQTKSMLTQATDQFKTQLDAETLTQFTTALDYIARLLPATLGCSWIVVMIISVIVAQMTLKQQGWNLRPGFDVKQTVLPRWLVVVAAVTAMAGYLAPAPYNYLGVNLCIMFCLAYFLAGLGVVHAWAATLKGGTWILVIYYILLAVPLPMTVIPVTLLTLFLGFSDQWIDFRRRFAGKKLGG